MPNLKCIGGPHDGEIVKFDDDQREVILDKSALVGPYLCRGLTIGSKSALIERTRYTRRKVKIGHDVWIEFLADARDSSEDVLRFALEP